MHISQAVRLAEKARSVHRRRAKMITGFTRCEIYVIEIEAMMANIEQLSLVWTG